MSRSSRFFVSSLAGLLFCLSLVTVARADTLTPIYGGQVVPTLFSYYAAYTGAGGTLETGDFFTIYDIGPYVTLSAPVAFGISTQLVGLTPPGVSPTDNGSIVNVTFTYLGPPTSASQTWASFFIVSNTDDEQTGVFSSQTHAPIGPAGPLGGIGGLPVGQVGTVTVPRGPGAPVPEPATMLLLGSGLAGIAVKVRKRRKSV